MLRPGNVGNYVVNARRGQRIYRLTLEGQARRMGKQTNRRPEVLPWAFERLRQCADLSSRKDRIAVATLDLRTAHMPMLLPHQVVATLLTSFPDDKAADALEQQLREILTSKGITIRLESVSSRAAMKDRRATARLMKSRWRKLPEI